MELLSCILQKINENQIFLVSRIFNVMVENCNWPVAIKRCNLVFYTSKHGNVLSIVTHKHCCNLVVFKFGNTLAEGLTQVVGDGKNMRHISMSYNDVFDGNMIISPIRQLKDILMVRWC